MPDMPIGDFCKRDVVVVSRDAAVAEAASLMRKHHVGALVVVSKGDGPYRPVGIVTDRDLVVEIMACGLDPRAILVEDIMLESLHTVGEKEGAFQTIRLMRQYGVRRLPVVNGLGHLEGIVTLDDLIGLLAKEIDELAKLIGREQAREIRKRP